MTSNENDGYSIKEIQYMIEEQDMPTPIPTQTFGRIFRESI